MPPAPTAAVPRPREGRHVRVPFSLLSSHPSFLASLPSLLHATEHLWHGCRMRLQRPQSWGEHRGFQHRRAPGSILAGYRYTLLKCDISALARDITVDNSLRESFSRSPRAATVYGATSSHRRYHGQGFQTHKTLLFRNNTSARLSRAGTNWIKPAHVQSTYFDCSSVPNSVEACYMSMLHTNYREELRRLSGRRVGGWVNPEYPGAGTTVGANTRTGASRWG